ncbi:uncharacterized protein LOC112348741 isoform X2 [Selaginella moellendorffii]|nr:uncharacterized protein LOC112348741 isoform X2 [Selaginella moellendorffii]|eukprot:XP_024537602.1 uncharacterized protein LOC112348741 isoform X2 [Selaginella moellendorffii]
MVLLRMVLLWIVLLFSSKICQADRNGLTQEKIQAAFVGDDHRLEEEEIIAEIVLGGVANQDEEVDEFFLVDEVEDFSFEETKVEEISPGKEVETIVVREDEPVLLPYVCTWGLILLGIVLAKKLFLRIRARGSKDHKLPVESFKPPVAPVDISVIETFGEIIAEALYKNTSKLSEEAVRGLSKEKLCEVIGRRKAERIARRFSRAFIAKY